ncbi:hypothetical protein EBR03_04945, partial [bacterium]|nr:hypothetical protein [bacterium]
MNTQVTLCEVSDYVGVGSLKFYDENPRTISKDRLEQLKESIKSKGFYQPILVWKSTNKKKHNTVLAGNHRLLAVKELLEEGFEFNHGKEKGVLPVVYESVSEAEALAILYDSNNTYADWVEEKLRTALKDCTTRQIADYGFTPQYVDTLLKNAITEADRVTEDLDKELETSPVDLDRLKNALGEDSAAVIVLNRDVFDSFNNMIAPLAKRLNKSWRVGDNLSEAVFVLMEKVEEEGLVQKLLAQVDETTDLDSVIGEESFEEIN